MYSENAKRAIDDFMEQGASLAPEEIIRLNAVGCALECGPDAAEMCAPPRCAPVGNVILWQPTIQSERWLTDVAARFARDDKSMVGFLCFACCHAREIGYFSALNEYGAILRAVRDWEKKLTCTHDELGVALQFVVCGSSPDSGEYPARTEREKNAAQAAAVASAASALPRDRGAWLISLAAATRLPFSFAELAAMDGGQILSAVLRARRMDGFEPPKSAGRQVDFIATANEIADKHKVVFHG